MKENPNTCCTIFIQKVFRNTDAFKIENAFQFNFGMLVSNLEMSHPWECSIALIIDFSFKRKYI